MKHCVNKLFNFQYIESYFMCALQLFDTIQMKKKKKKSWIQKKCLENR